MATDRTHRSYCPAGRFIWLGMLMLLARLPAQQSEARQQAIEQFRAHELARTTAVVMGRCIDSETGTPLAGCRVVFMGASGNRRAMALHGPVEWQDPAPIVTGPDGRFEFRFVPPPPFQHRMTIECDGRYRRTARWGAFEPGQIEDLDDVELRPGHRVRGRLVDTAGRPVARTSIGFNHLCFPITTAAGERPRRGGIPPARPGSPPVTPTNATHDLANQMIVAHSGDDGWFETRDLLPAGTWPLHLSVEGLTLVRPSEVTVGADGTLEPSEIVVREEPFLSGVVVDENGAPVAGADLLGEQDGGRRLTSGSSHKDGTFKIYRTGALAEETVRLRVTGGKGCEPSAKPTEALAWGTKDITIVVERALRFPLTVVEADSGVPVTDFSVDCHATGSGSRSRSERGPRLGGTHDGGKVVVDEVWRGPNVLRVIPKDRQLAPSVQLHFEATSANPGPARVEVVRLTPMKVTVVDGRGEPVADRTVELILPGNEPFAPDDKVLDPRGDRRMWSSDPQHVFPELVYAEKTDRFGQCWIYGYADRADHIVRIDLGDRGAFVENDVRFGEDRLLRELVVR